MFFICVMILMAIGYSCLYVFVLPVEWTWYFHSIWVVLGIISSLLTFVLYVLLFIEIGAKTTPKSKFKVFNLCSATKFFCVLYHIKMTVEGVENVPKDEAFVVYSNHKSNMDPVCIYTALNRITSAVGKKSLFMKWPMNHICKCFGAISMDRDNDREGAKNLIQAIKAVKDGLPMIVFPEGGIKSRDVEEMVNLRAGAYKLAMKANAPIIPTTIIGSSAISKEKRTKKKNVHIIFHEPLTKEWYQGKNTTEVGTYVENIINEDIRKYEKK